MDALDVSRPTVERIRKRFVEGGLDRALNEDPRLGQQRKLDGRGEAQLIAIACSQAPVGHDHWTVRLLAGKLVELGVVESISHETVRLTLKKTMKPWQKRMWCIPEANAEYVACMEDVLDQYEQPYDPKRPLVCFDEWLKQLIEETRIGLPAKPGQVERYDYEYRRNGVRNLNLCFEPLVGQRHVMITERHTMQDIAHCMKWLVDEIHPEVEIIRVVLDNLNTHKSAALYKTYPPAEALRIIKKLEFHYTPKHASWLNMAEIELSVFGRRLKKHIPVDETLTIEVDALVDDRNQGEATVDWQFRTDDARIKLKRLYPSILG